MKQRVFVRVVGFNDVERHALNSIFRLSQDKQTAREWSYEPWLTGSPAAPRLALIDGSSPNASEALAEIETLGGIGIIWVGSISPAKAWNSFLRPIRWPDVLRSMDDYFSPDSGLDVDLGGDTWPSILESTGSHMFPEPEGQRVFMADADAASRMYLRTKLSAFGLMHLDEAETVTQAREFLTPANVPQPAYDMVIIDLDLPGGDAWSLVASCGRPRLKLLTRERLSLSNRFVAKFNGCAALNKPYDPAALNALLNKFQA
jgi:CheY-like chemotaxis protein